MEPNFYYAQEDALWAYCKENSIGWNIGMPAASTYHPIAFLFLLPTQHSPLVLGAVPDAAMNVCFPIAIYATVSAYLKQPLVFPGDIAGWQFPVSQSSAMLNGYLEEWAVLSPNTENEKFNACDSSAFSCESFWPRLAEWYGIGWKGPEMTGLKEIEWGYDPPPRGSVGSSFLVCFSSFSIS